MVHINKNKIPPDKVRVIKNVDVRNPNPKSVKTKNISEKKKRTTKNSVSKKVSKDIYVSDDEFNDNNTESINQYIEESFRNDFIKDIRSIINDTDMIVEDKRLRVNAINNKYENHKKMYRTIKTSLKSIVITPTHNKIFNIVSNMNKIVIHTYQFFKMYMLHHYHYWKEFPIINQYLIVSIMKTIAVPGQKERNKN